MKLRLFKEIRITKRTPFWMVQYRQQNKIIKIETMIFILQILLGIVLVLGFWYLRHLFSVRCV